MKRICYVIPSLSVGGTERQLVRLVCGLVPNCEVSVICTHHDGAMAGDVRRSGAELRVLDSRGGWDFTLGRRLFEYFRSHPTDILHTFLFGFDWFANRAARKAGVPIIVSSRRQLATWRKRRHLLVQRLGNRSVDCIVANSTAVAQFVVKHEGVDETRLRVIPNGIVDDDFVCTTGTHPLRQRHRIPFNRHVVGIVANFSPVKDHRLFVSIAAELLRRRADLHFLLVGAGPLLESIGKAIGRLDVADCFTHVSTVFELPEFYKLMDVSVLCSKSEGFPNVLIESMAAGTPVVAAAVGGVPEIVRHEQTGRLVHTRDPKAFADAVEHVLDHPEGSAAMAARAAAFVREELTVDRMVDAYDALYGELLARRGHGDT